MKRLGVRILLLLGLLLFIYIGGVLVRGQYGIRILINNQSAEVVRNVALKEETHGPRHELGDFSIGIRKRTFIEPRTESHMVLQFQDASGRPCSETIVG